MGEPSTVTKRYVDQHDAHLDVSLKEYCDTRLDALEKLINERFSSQEKALQIASETANKRLEGMNEFRLSLSDQNKTFITKNESTLISNAICNDIEKMQDEIRSLQLSRAELSGKASQNQLIIVLIISLASLAASVMRLFIK